MLSVKEQDLVEDNLLSMIAKMPAPRATIVSFLREELAIVVPEGLPAVVAIEALKLCLKDGYARTALTRATPYARLGPFTRSNRC